MKGKEPSTGLIHPFCDEIGREVLLENVLIFERVMPLGIGHGAAIKPHINKVEFAGHGLTRGTHQGNAVHVRAVQILG